MVGAAGAGAGVGGAGGRVWQAVSAAMAVPSQAAASAFLQCATIDCRTLAVWLILLEALLALALFVFIIWWTMFHGRGKKK
jgi:hypothetical protein